MRRSAVIRRVLLGALVVVLVLVAGSAVVAVSTVRSSMATTDGTATLPGLTASVTVLRDGDGVPHIYGDSPTDLARAQGYVHAQERFFQMDLGRHITAGRLSELVGPAGLASDRVVRTLGWRAVAEAELPTLQPQTRRMLQAYADGVNSYLRGRSPSEVSLEYAVLGLSHPLRDIEDWTPVDSLAWLKAVAWDKRANYSDELTRARLAGRLSTEQIAEIYPPYDADSHPPVLSEQDWQPGQRPPVSTSSLNRALTSTPATGTIALPDLLAATGSAQAQTAFTAVEKALDAVPAVADGSGATGGNSWVVAGARTSTGKPLLANDPHAQVTNPGTWIQNSLTCREVSFICPFDVTGFSYPGVPGVVIGHNADIAWGMTASGADVTDLYLERIVGNTYQVDGAWTPLTTRVETIRVAGGDDERITVRSTGHGPVLSDILASAADAGANAPTEQGGDDNQNYAVSLAWPGLSPGHTADAILAMDVATDFAAFRTAAQQVGVPGSNFTFASGDGHIGFVTTGTIPIRRAALRGTPPGYWPAPGWNSAYDWTGFVDPGSLPWTYDPPEGLIVAANQEITSRGTPFLTTEWDPGWRSSRILDLLSATQQLSPADMQAIQGDTNDPFVRQLVPALLSVPLNSTDGSSETQDLLDFTNDARELLREWDGTMPADGSTETAAAVYYNAVWRNLCELLFDDELPVGLKSDGGARWQAAVLRLLATPKSAWWDDKLTPNITEGKDEILRRALVQARLDLTQELGKDPSQWQWGKLHRVSLTHPALGGEDQPAILQWLFNDGPYGVPGSSSTVNAFGWDANIGYDVVSAPSMRMVVDLSNLDASTWIVPGGVSGHPFSGSYSDQTSRWVEGEQQPWPFTEASVQEASSQRLTLVPGQ